MQTYGFESVFGRMITLRIAIVGLDRGGRTGVRVPFFGGICCGSLSQEYTDFKESRTSNKLAKVTLLQRNLDLEESAMSQAIVNPEELHQFTAYLDRFRQELMSHMQGLAGKFQTLGQSWRDQQRQKFAQEFETTMRVLQRFLVTTENEHLPYLRKKVEEARKYLHG